jgi:hypothetical protein
LGEVTWVGKTCCNASLSPSHFTETASHPYIGFTEGTFMRFTLAFSHNSEGLFRVTASANSNAHKGTGFVVAIYKDKAFFCRLVQAAGLQLEETQRLTAAVELTEFNRSTPACCEDVDLDDEQLKFFALPTHGRFSLGHPL